MHERGIMSNISGPDFIVEELRQGPFGMTFSFKDPDGYVLTVHDGG